MRRVFYDVVSKYTALSEDIKKECGEEAGLYDFDDQDNYIYDFESGFVAFVNFDGDYFVNVGFLEGAEPFKKCKEALNHFVINRPHVNIYSRVNAENKKAQAFNNAIGFKQIYKIYKYEAK